MIYGTELVRGLVLAAPFVRDGKMRVRGRNERRRVPKSVVTMLLAAPSNGFNVDAFGGADWRSDYRRTFPQAGDWGLERVDYTDNVGRTTAPKQGRGGRR